MYGEDTGSLQIYHGNGEEPVFTVTGEQGDEWRDGQVDMEISSGEKVGGGILVLALEKEKAILTLGYKSQKFFND